MDIFKRDYIIVNEKTGLYYDYFYEFARFTNKLITSKHFEDEVGALICISNHDLEHCVPATVSLDIKELDERLENNKKKIFKIINSKKIIL